MIGLGEKDEQEGPGEGSGVGSLQEEGQHEQRPPVEGALGELELQLDHGWSRVGRGEAGEAGSILMPQGWSHSGNYQMHWLTLEEPGSGLNSKARALFYNPCL